MFLRDRTHNVQMFDMLEMIIGAKSFVKAIGSRCHAKRHAVSVQRSLHECFFARKHFMARVRAVVTFHVVTKPILVLFLPTLSVVQGV